MMSLTLSSTSNTSDIGEATATIASVLHWKIIERQLYVERRALAERALRPGLSSVSPRESRHDGETDAVTTVVVTRVESLEHAEEFLGVAHVEADALVAHEVHDVVALDLAADLD